MLAYLELSRYLAVVNAPPIFPKEATRRRLAALLRTAEPATPFESGLRQELLSRQPLLKEASRPRAEDDALGHGGPAHARAAPLGLRDFIDRVKRWSEDAAEGTLGGYPESGPSVAVPEHARVYIKSAIPEFSAELQVYRSWVIAGADPIPTMNIPASPLDSNVDVPVDTW